MPLNYYFDGCVDSVCDAVEPVDCSQIRDREAMYACTLDSEKRQDSCPFAIALSFIEVVETSGVVLESDADEDCQPSWSTISPVRILNGDLTVAFIVRVVNNNEAIGD